MIPGPIGNVDTEIDADTDGHILLWSIPGQKLSEVREGYEDLTKPETPTDPLLSQPTYKVKIERKVMISMRDGAKLATDIIRPDADWFVMLQDIYPDGHSATLCRGIIRARFRKSFTTPTLLQPNEIAGYDLDLWAVGIQFQKGHRLQVILTSSCFPTYARNLNTGGDLATETKMATARQTIYHTPSHLSYLVLPILPE